MLYIVRHAWAAERHETNFSDDGQRPLTPEGKQRFRRVVECLAERGFRPKHVATSPLVRCRETAEIIAESLSNAPEVETLEALAPDSYVDASLRWTARLGDVDVAWVGHAPDVGEMVATRIGDGSALVRFSKGAVAALDFNGLPERGEGVLRWLVTAKMLGC